MKWPKITIQTPCGPEQAIAPEVISASRSTDIPAFHAEWFMNRLDKGYVKWINPFNQRPSYISFENARAVVFWTKNARPLVPFLNTLDARRLAYYFQFTVNDYTKEGLEPGVPELASRVETFRELSARLGKERVIWRFDPLILTGDLSVDALLDKIRRVGDRIAPHTQKLVFSFADVDDYKKVQNSLSRGGFRYREFTREEMGRIAQEISGMCRAWGIKASTCGESVDLKAFGIEHNKCIDDKLILKLCGNDPRVRRLYGADKLRQGDLFLPEPDEKPPNVKDPGQRPECGCAFSKDIGQYNTCPHLCAYCYANTSENVVRKNACATSPHSETIVKDTASKPRNG